MKKFISFFACMAIVFMAAATPPNIETNAVKAKFETQKWTTTAAPMVVTTANSQEKEDYTTSATTPKNVASVDFYVYANKDAASQVKNKVANSTFYSKKNYAVTDAGFKKDNANVISNKASCDDANSDAANVKDNISAAMYDADAGFKDAVSEEDANNNQVNTWMTPSVKLE